MTESKDHRQSPADRTRSSRTRQGCRSKLSTLHANQLNFPTVNSSSYRTAPYFLHHLTIVEFIIYFVLGRPQKTSHKIKRGYRSFKASPKQNESLSDPFHCTYKISRRPYETWYVFLCDSIFLIALIHVL